MIFGISIIALIGLFLTSFYLVYRLPHHSTLVDDLKNGGSGHGGSGHGGSGVGGNGGGGVRNSLISQSLTQSELEHLVHNRDHNNGGVGGNNGGGETQDDDQDDAEQDDTEQTQKQPNKEEELYAHVKSIRKPLYQHMEFPELTYDVNNCPDDPPDKYPIEWPLMNIIDNWNPNNTTFAHAPIDNRPHIHQGLCRFDYRTELHKAKRYREREVPFIMRDDPQILQTVQRWNTPGYLTSLLGDDVTYKSEYSESNHLMFYRMSKDGKDRTATDWKPPMQNVDITYPQWLEKANQPLEDMAPDKPHWYFRVNAKAKGAKGFLYQEMPYFKPKENFYMVDTSDVRGINCRFGMTGNIAENHFDGSRNFIILFGGERRYILNHPKNCRKLGLYPRTHPSGRHSAIDWTDPDTNMFPQFAEARGNEVVMQAGDALYLPTQWFHFIISLETNWQCNARSGITNQYQSWIKRCGF